MAVTTIKGGKTRTSAAHGKNTLKKPAFNPTTSFSSKDSLTKSQSRPSASTGTIAGSITTTKRKAESSTNEGKDFERDTISSSILNTPDEIDFPRGGGTNLTQIEVREAQLEGEQEAMADAEVN